MKRIKPYHLLFLALLPILAACGGKKMNERVSLWRNDKIPYGCWYAYNQLDHIFPDAEVVVNKISPDRYKNFNITKAKQFEEASQYDDKKSVYLIITGEVMPDNSEVVALLNMVGQGKHVFISTSRVAPKLLDSLRLKTAYYSDLFNYRDSLTVQIGNPLSTDSAVFSYPGKSLDNFIVEMDTSITSILGRDKWGRANFVKFDYEGGGSLYLHLAPLAFTNFFLLHKGNKAYYDNALSFLPKDIEVVRWDDYFRYHSEGGNNENSGNNFSRLDWLSKQRGLSAALWLVLVMFLLIYLVESKRKQRIIPELPSLKNASLDFVQTIGRLYYQRRDNKNLAQKMTAHFIGHVRSKYNIRISVADEEYEKRLAWKTGLDPAAIRDLMYYIQFVQDQPVVTDEALMGLNQRLEAFYQRNT